MKYFVIIVYACIDICFGIVGWLNARKEADASSEPLDTSFLVHFMISVPMLLATIYVTIFKPGYATTLLNGVIFVFGAIAMVYAIWHHHKSKR